MDRGYEAERDRHSCQSPPKWGRCPAGQRGGAVECQPQFPIAGYIGDFACPDKKLVVEVDGSQHADANAGDEARTKRLEQDGWTVLRFWNDDVIRDIDNVCQHIVIEAGLAGTT
ncbi:endonuclease domain-containing protein [Mesorhizobium sp.]|uniref:endonuclease domain-containing protein n=1 Tax=Mesorhizobium sp. TaxID=1871066 RepID=UPI000FE52991|nr:endonuclease domain-containing protein [Mesorhizobium sp.]RWO21597.1 MAG: endonuclease domain-containing protein [Mesorhizobium sp.]